MSQLSTQRTLLLLLALPVTFGTIGCSEPASTVDKDEPAKAAENEGKDEKSKPKDDKSEPEPLVMTEDQVLRHAVFFGFPDTPNPDGLQEVKDAFRGLPDKIPAIIDFGCGENNSPEGLNDGFTHCFLLTFKDDAGRKEYLPHPDHKAFGDVLRPHKPKVFVIDYVAPKAEPPAGRLLKHAVFFRFKKEATPEDIKKVEAAFAALPDKISEIKAFEWGTNNSPERHDHGFTHCFMVTFDSEEGRKVYLDHPDHLAFVEVLKPHLDAPRVMDFWYEK